MCAIFIFCTRENYFYFWFYSRIISKITTIFTYTGISEILEVTKLFDLALNFD